jgi:hypothetical protein
MDRIDNYRDNWWCTDVGAQVDQINYVKDESLSREGLTVALPKEVSAPPSFLSPDQQKAADAEWQQLARSGAGSSYLTRETLAWAKAKPQDPRVPEALHFAVRSTRYGCDDAQVSKLSHQAFRLLHSRYPNSKWAKQTPYWY